MLPTVPCRRHVGKVRKDASIMKQLGTGLIGCGKIAEIHAQGLTTLPESRFLAVCDIDQSRADDFARRYMVPHAFTDLVEMLRTPGLEAVLVCTPHRLHAPCVIAAAEAGIHVMCEKPIASDLEAADAMIAATTRAGVSFSVIFQRRFWPAAQRLRAAIDGGKLGRLILGDCVVKWWRPAEYYGLDPWRGKWDSEGGGVLINQAVHALDHYLWYMGEVESVFAYYATLAHPGIEVEDTAVAALRFKSGALGTVTCSVCQNPTLYSRISVHGDNGASASLLEQPEGVEGINDIWTIPGEEEEIGTRQRTTIPSPGFPTFHHLQIQDFLRRVGDGREPTVTGESARRSLALILAIYESARTGKQIAL
jgi:UDP-N-acetyl-2-amino-2-deoxyglucuronate dehydrogenase